MSGKRAVWLLPVLGLIGSQAGHLIAYELRYGNAAQQVQSGGAHSYFPAAAKTGLGLAALGLLVALLIVGAARLATGRHINADAAPSFMRVLAALYTIQLACFAAQETIEALAAGGQMASAPTLVLLGSFGQLPVALAGALALRWLGARLRPAIAAIRLAAGAIYQNDAYVVALRTWALAANALTVQDTTTAGFNRRGPPSF